MTLLVDAKSMAFAALALLMGGVAACADEQDAAPEPRVYFVNIEDGAVVSNPVTILFGLENFEVAPAGVEKPNTGHHHLLIDTELTAGDKGQPLPADDHHKHFGGGQTETTLTLAPGEHVLQLVLGDHNHVPFDPPIVSERITVTVK